MTKTRIGEIVERYQHTHLNLGKLVPKGKVDKKHFLQTNLRLKRPTWNINWRMNKIIAIMIREYLRWFIQESPTIGNCVIDEDYPDRKPWDEIDTDYYDARWKALVNKTADKFDEYVKLYDKWAQADCDVATAKELKAKIKEAFEMLADIYVDLYW